MHKRLSGRSACRTQTSISDGASRLEGRLRGLPQHSIDAGDADLELRRDSVARQALRGEAMDPSALLARAVGEEAARGWPKGPPQVAFRPSGRRGSVIYDRPYQAARWEVRLSAMTLGPYAASLALSFWTVPTPTR